MHSRQSIVTRLPGWLAAVLLPALALAWGTPARAQLVISPGAFSVTLPQGHEEARVLTITNDTDAAVAFCITFDRPLQTLLNEEVCSPSGELLLATETQNLPNASLVGITMTPEGRIFAPNYSGGHTGNFTHEFDAELNHIRAFVHPRVREVAPVALTRGVAYVEETNTLWWLNLEVSQLEMRRAMLLEGTLDGVPTGRRIVLPLVPAPPPYTHGLPQGLEWEPVQQLFYYVDGINDMLWAVDTLGQAAPGYPADIQRYLGSEAGNGVDAFGGLEGGPEGVRLEVPIWRPQDNRYTRVALLDRFGESQGIETPIPPLGDEGAMSSHSFRSRQDPNGLMYFTYNSFSTRGVVAIRPHPLPPSWLWLSAAGNAWRGTIQPGESREITLTFRAAETRPVGRYSSTLQVMSPDGMVAEVPVVLDVTKWTSTEPVVAGGSAALSVYPNPASRNAEVLLDVASPAHLVVEVFDVLGRRVRVLADGMRQPGKTVLAVEGLSPGVYVVRAVVDGQVVTRRLTVL
jgi:hypothetical protein